MTTTPSRPQVHRYHTTEYLSRAHGDEFIVVIDSLGRRWNPLLHPRDSKGRFIRTFSFVTFDLPGGGTASGRVSGIDKDGSLLVKVQGTTPGAPEGMEGSYVKVPHDQVTVQTVKAQLTGKGSHVGILQKQQNNQVTNGIKHLRAEGMDEQADKLAEAQRLAMETPDARSPESVANKERAIELFREVAEEVDTERGKGFAPGDDYEEIKAQLPSKEKARLQRLDAVTNTTYTARHSLGDKTITDIETSQGQMKGNMPQTRIEAAENELVKGFAEDVKVWDITSGSLVESELEPPVKAEVRDTVAEPVAEGLPELWRSAYQKLRSGKDRLAGYRQAMQVAPGDRHHEDKNGDKVRVGMIAHFDKTKSRAEFDGMVIRIYTDPAKKKHIYGRDFDPDGSKGYLATYGTPYHDWSVDGGSMELASEDQQSTLFQKLALEGQDEASKSLVQSFTDEYITAMQRRFATPGALKVSGVVPGFFDIVPIHLRHKKDGNGEKLRIGDAVSGPNGEDGFVSYMEPNSPTTKVYWHNGESARLSANKLKRWHGPTSEVYPDDSTPGTNNYVPTREEAAAIAEEKGAASVAGVIRDGGDAHAIQAAMVTDVAFQGELDDVDALYEKRDQTRAAGQTVSDEDRTELDKWAQMFMASTGTFREPDDPPPVPPAAPAPDPEMEEEAPQNPDNPTEKVTPEGVVVREEDGNVIVDDNTEDPISSDDQQAIDQAVEDAAQREEAPEAEEAPAQSLADRLVSDMDRLVEEAKGAPNVDTNQRAQLDQMQNRLADAVKNQDGDGVVRALQGLTTTVNRQVNANLRQTRLAAVLNGRATGGTPMADFVQQKLDAGEDIFGAPAPVVRQERPAERPDESPEGVDPKVDAVDTAVSEALLMDDGTTMVMRGDEQVDEGFYVVDPATVTEYDAEPTTADITDFLDETDGSSYDGISIWYDEADGRFRMARVGIFDDEQDAADSARTTDTNQYVNIADGAVMNIATDADQNSPAEAVEDPRSEERAVRVAGAGKASARSTKKQKAMLDHVAGVEGADPEISRITEAVKSGEEINGADASRLADYVDGLGADQFEKPSDKGVAAQLAHRLARAAGEEGARGYSSQNTALRRTSDVSIPLTATAEDPQIRQLVDEARADIRNGDNAAAAEKFRAAADLYDAEGHSRTDPSTRAREHADRLDAMGGATEPAPAETAPEGAPPTPVESGPPPPPPPPTPTPAEPEAEPGAERTPTEILEDLFDQIGQPEDYGTEHQGRMLGEARALATEGLTDDAADRLESAAAAEPDDSDTKQLMLDAAAELRGETEGAAPEDDDSTAGGPEVPAPIPFGRPLPEGWSSPPGSTSIIRSEDDGSLIIANPDTTFTVVRADGASSQLNSVDEALAFAGGDDPDTKTSDEESVQAGLINPAHPTTADFSRTADDTALTHVPSGDTITVEPDAEKPFVARDEDGAVQARSESLDKAMAAVEKDTEEEDGDEEEDGSPLQNVLSTHPSRDFSLTKKGKPAVDKKTGQPLTAHQARTAALRAAGRAQGREAFGSGNFHAVVGTTMIKAKVISGDREGYELDPSETDLFASLAAQIAGSNVPQSTKDRLDELLDPAGLASKRMFVDSKGGAIVAVDPDGRIIGPFTGNNAALQGAHGDAAEQLTRKAVRGGGRYAWTSDDADAQLLARVGLKGTHQLPDGSITYQYDPERVGEKYDRSKLTTAPNLATALQDHDNWRQLYESNPFHIALDQGEMGDTHVYADVPDIDSKTGQQRVDKDGNLLTYSKKGPWGRHGASGLVVRAVDPTTGEDRFLMVQRSKHIGNSYKWQFGGGAINSNETGEQGAAREFFEETQPPVGWLGDLTHVGTNTTTNATFNWQYANVAADTQTMFDPTLDYESADAQWFTRQEIADLEVNGDLLPSVAASIRDTLTLWGGTPQSVLPAGTLRPAPVPSAPGEIGEIGEIGDEQLPFDFDLPRTIEPSPITPTSTKTHVRAAGGSNGAAYYDVEMSDGSTQQYVIKKLKPDAGRQEALASALYRALGIDAPEVTYNEDERALYSKVVEGVSSGSFTPQQTKAMRDGFATDAWLAAWDIRRGDNTLLTRDGKPVRIDNGGTLEYRAQGSKKGTDGTVPFGNTVGELDTFRDGQTQASQIYGKRGSTPDSWEADSAQKVVDLSDEDIRGLVSDFQLPDTLADTLIARKQDIAARYSLSPSTDAPNPTAPNAMKGAPDEVMSQVAEDADHPDGSTSATEAASPASATAVEAGTAHSLGHSTASDETKWADDKDRSNLIPVAKVGEAHTLTMSDGSTRDYAVYAPKTPEQGQRMQLASALYNELGISTPEIDYDAAEGKVYSALTGIGPDRGAAGHPDVAAGFVMDAWLGNLRISSKSISYAPDGTPIRTDMRYVLGGAKTPLDPHGVGATLEGLRNPGVNQAAAGIFGSRSGGFDDFEYDGAAEILSISDDHIRELVANAGLDSTMADTLITRRDGIRDYYHLVDPSTPVLSKISFTATNEAESLRDAKRGLSTSNKIGYVRSHMADGTSYTDLLKSSRGLDNAFDTLWRETNPDKPDSIFRQVQATVLGQATPVVNNSGQSIATHDVSNISAQDVIDLAKDFDTSQQAWDDAAADFKAAGSAGDDGQVALQLIQAQRGYQDTNEEVSPDEFAKLVSSDHTHVFRGSTGATLTSIREGNWRGGTGMRAHGSGVYTTTDISTAMQYGYSGEILDMAFEQATANIADSHALYALASSLNNAVVNDTTLSAEERRFLMALLGSGGGFWGRGDVGALAALLGFDAVQGNNHYGSGYDFNILNKRRVRFARNAKLISVGMAYNYTHDQGRSSNSGWGNGVRNPVLIDAEGRDPDVEPEEEEEEETPTGEDEGDTGGGEGGEDGGAGDAGGGAGGGPAV